jgi:hypothetical protein
MKKFFLYIKSEVMPHEWAIIIIVSLLGVLVAFDKFGYIK